MSKESVNVIYSPKASEHKPPFDIYNGVMSPSFDTPSRAHALIKEVRALQASTNLKIVDTREFGLTIIHDVHDANYIDHLRRTSERVAQKPPMKVAQIIDENRGASDIVEYPAFAFPSVFPHGSNPRTSNRVGERGLYSYDTATPVMGNTYEVSIAAADTALTGAELLLSGTNCTYALCRPPGHHAETNRMGGYCYINNAAVAANYIQGRSGKQVAILDLDAHHGNGTQQIFYHRGDVSYTSIHVDPTDQPPYYYGYADERGESRGVGSNLNIPLPSGTNDNTYLNALDKALIYVKEAAPAYMVVSIGFDGYKGDPLQLFNLSTDVFRESARRISALDIPTLSVQEGGYDVKTLGLNISEYIKGWMNPSS